MNDWCVFMQQWRSMAQSHNICAGFSYTLDSRINLFWSFHWFYWSWENCRKWSDLSCNCLCLVRALEVESRCSLSAVMHRSRRPWKINERVSFTLIFLSNTSNCPPMGEALSYPNNPSLPLTTSPCIPPTNVTHSSIISFKPAAFYDKLFCPKTSLNQFKSESNMCYFRPLLAKTIHCSSHFSPCNIQRNKNEPNLVSSFYVYYHWNVYWNALCSQLRIK